MNNHIGVIIIALTAPLIILSNIAMAYLGPGAGLGAMGSIIAIIVATLVVVMDLVIYPIPKYMSRKSKTK